MNKKTEKKIEATFKKHFPSLIADLAEIFEEITFEEKCKLIIQLPSSLILALSKEADETILFLINIVGNLTYSVLIDCENGYSKDGIDYIKEKIIKMLPQAFQACLESVGFDWRKDLEKRIENELHKVDCDCPYHQAMKEKSIH